MSPVNSEMWQSLNENVQGRVVLPEDPAYDEARMVWNGMFDRRPLAVLQARGVEDVQRGVELAQEQELLLAVRGGGHNVAGNGTVDGGLVIDLGPMRATQVDREKRLVQVGGGATLGDLDRATQAEGLAVPVGVVSRTGVAGLTLGGGVGYLTRAYGLSLDNLRSAQVVTADGTVLGAGPEEHAELFWGLRGGGGNFGIVTSFEFQAHPLGPEIYAGTVIYRPESWSEGLRFFEEWSRDLPDELTTIISFLAPAPEWGLPGELTGKTVMLVAFAWAGSDQARAEATVAPLLEHKAAALALAEPTSWTDLQSEVDDFFPPGLRAYWKSLYFDDLDDEIIAILDDFASRRSSPNSGFDIHHMGGAFARVPEEATAFPNRKSRYWLNIYGVWAEPKDDAEQIAWVRGLYNAMEPRSAEGMYVNFQGSEKGADALERARAAYGQEKLERLRRLKDRYDPQNLFRLNHNIPPT